MKELERCKSFSDLQSFHPLVQFFKQFYKSELETAQAKETLQSGAAPQKAMPRIRSCYDMLDSIKAKGIVSIARNYFISPMHFVENYTRQMIMHKAPISFSEIEERINQIDDENQR